MIRRCAFFPAHPLPPQGIQRNSAKAAHNRVDALQSRKPPKERGFQFTPERFVKASNCRVLSQVIGFRGSADDLHLFFILCCLGSGSVSIFSQAGPELS
jgi:hypothetical protein